MSGKQALASAAARRALIATAVLPCRAEQIAEEANQGQYVQVAEGPSGFPVVRLRHNDGAEAVVHLHGGHVSSWTDHEGLEMLHLHPETDFNPSHPIRHVFCRHSVGLSAGVQPPH